MKIEIKEGMKKRRKGNSLFLVFRVKLRESNSWQLGISVERNKLIRPLGPRRKAPHEKEGKIFSGKNDEGNPGFEYPINTLLQHP